jgi:hypothetical protein
MPEMAAENRPDLYQFWLANRGWTMFGEKVG